MATLPIGEHVVAIVGGPRLDLRVGLVVADADREAAVSIEISEVFGDETAVTLLDAERALRLGADLLRAAHDVARRPTIRDGRVVYLGPAEEGEP